MILFGIFGLLIGGRIIVLSVANDLHSAPTTSAAVGCGVQTDLEEASSLACEVLSQEGMEQKGLSLS